MDDIKHFAKSPEAKAQSARLKASAPEPSAADLEEIPELTDEELASMRRAVIKQPVTVRLDSDIIEWLKEGDGRYQTRLNSILRIVMNRVRAR